MAWALLGWGLVGLAASGVMVAGAAVALGPDRDGRSAVIAQVAQDTPQVSSPFFNGPGPYPSAASQPSVQRDSSRPVQQLSATVYAYPIVDEFGTAGIEIVDEPSQASFAWIPGRPPLTFLGNPLYDATCDCIANDLGFQRIRPFTLEPERLARLARGEPYYAVGERPQLPPGTRAPDSCSGPQCPTPGRP